MVMAMARALSKSHGPLILLHDDGGKAEMTDKVWDWVLCESKQMVRHNNEGHPTHKKEQSADL